MLAKRIMTRVQSSLARNVRQHEQTWLTYVEYLDVMADLKYREPGDETLELESENLWRVMTSSQIAGDMLSPKSMVSHLNKCIEDYFSPPSRVHDIPGKSIVSFQTFISYIYAIENVTMPLQGAARTSRLALSPNTCDGDWKETREEDGSRSLRRISSQFKPLVENRLRLISQA